MPRFRSTISLIRRGGTRTSFASLYCEIPIGFRNSSERTSPGCTGGSFEDLVVVDNFDLIGMARLPFETNAPLHVDRNTPLTCAIALQLLQPIARRDKEVVDTRR